LIKKTCIEKLLPKEKQPVDFSTRLSSLGIFSGVDLILF